VSSTLRTRMATVVVAVATMAWLTAGVVAADESPSPSVPTATADTYTTPEDVPLQVVAPGLLANDHADPMTCAMAVVTTDFLAGTVDIHADGSFVFSPAANFNGDTSFVYRIGSDPGTGCSATIDSTATVTITVTPVNDAPTAVADSFTALKDRTLNVAAPGVLGNDSDIDGDPLTAAKASSPSHGVVTLASDGSFSYTPNAGYVGPDAFSYRASDGMASSAQRVVSLSVVAVPPPPTPTPAPTPTQAPTALPTPEPSASEAPVPSDSGFVVPSVGPSESAAASATAGPVGGPVSGQGGPPLVEIGALALLVGLLAVAGVYFMRSQRSGDDAELEPGVDGGFGDDEVDGDERR
jgi:cadherin-like protein